jgi:hypothetical protein
MYLLASSNGFNFLMAPPNVSIFPMMIRLIKTGVNLRLNATKAITLGFEKRHLNPLEQ